MGDVFDAMNRSKKERGEKQAEPQASPKAAGAAGSPRDDTSAGLPFDQLANARSIREEANDTPRAPGTGASGRLSGVVDAVAKSEGELASKPDAAKPSVVAAAAAKAKASAATPAATLPQLNHDPSLNGYASQVIVHHDRGSVITEQYRAIRTQILARGRNRKLQVHAVTSSAPEEGKSVTTINLGMTFSELRNQKILLIEGDLRRPTFHKLFNRQATPGLIHLLRGQETDIDKAIHPTAYDNLQFMPAGDRDFVSSTELLSSPKMHQILDRLRDRYDHIFLDTPPVITVTDACILGAMADETLLVVRLNRTPSDLVDRAKRLLRASNCDVAGVILTHMVAATSKYLYRYT